MNTYSIKLEIKANIQAFNEDDAIDYISDIFGVDDTITNYKIVDIREN
jgi:hypothetical protein